MKIKTLLSAACAVVLVLGCASPPRTFTPKQCPPAACETTVRIDVSTGTPVISIDDPELKMHPGDRNPVVTWILVAPAGYEFRSDSIKPHTGAPSGGKQTTTQTQWDSQLKRLANNATRFLVQNKNEDTGTFYYDVTVYNRATGQGIPLDPAIMNDP